jgi:hypothetical protein
VLTASLLYVQYTGDARASVVATSLRIITRLKKDWITTGRRPDGEICVRLAVLVH